MTRQPKCPPPLIIYFLQGTHGISIGQISERAPAIDALRIFEIDSVTAVTRKAFHSSSLPNSAEAYEHGLASLLSFPGKLLSLLRS